VSRSNAAYRGIISQSESAPYSFGIRWQSTNQISCYYNNSGFSYAYNPGTAWFHVCATQSHKDNVRRFYINGALINETGSVETLTASTDNLLIGCDYVGYANGRMWIGLIDAVSIHHRALSPDEIRALAAHRLMAYIPRRRTVRRLYSIPATFHPAWARHSNIYIPAGARLA
jgi:hypothetical protein